VARGGEAEPDLDDMASSYPTRACEWSLNASPMSLVMLYSVSIIDDSRTGPNLPPYDYFVNHAAPETRYSRAQLRAIYIDRIIVEQIA
jgi:hypothetical protein